MSVNAGGAAQWQRSNCDQVGLAYLSDNASFTFLHRLICCQNVCECGLAKQQWGCRDRWQGNSVAIRESDTQQQCTNIYLTLEVCSIVPLNDAIDSPFWNWLLGNRTPHCLASRGAVAIMLPNPLIHAAAPSPCLLAPVMLKLLTVIFFANVSTAAARAAPFCSHLSDPAASPLRKAYTKPCPSIDQHMRSLGLVISDS